jgi:SAM-dependent methyltransferase
MLEYEEFLSRHLADFSSRKKRTKELFSSEIQIAVKKNKRTRSSFSAEWEGHDYEKGKTWELGIEDQLTRFFKESGEDQHSLNGKRVLDAGCGNGHLAMAISRLGAELIAMDFSSSVIRAKGFNRSSSCHFLQADVEFPPFDSSVFDLVHSSGVLIHTPDTKRSFRILSALVKPGGKISIWVYRKRKEILHRFFNRVRTFSSSLPPFFQRIFLGLFIFIPALLIKRLKGNRQHTHELWVEVLDWFTPEFRWEHEEAEVKDWFTEEAFSDIRVSDENHWGFNVTGIRS